MTDMRNWQCVIVFGKFEELKGKEAEKALAILFDRVYPVAPSSTIHTFGHDENEKIDNGTQIKHVMYRIKIKKITGRSEKT